MNFKTMVNITSVFFLVMALSSTIFAKNKDSKNRKRGGILKQLDLSKEQREKITAFRKENQPEIKELRNSIKSLRKEIKEAFKNDKPESELKGLHSKMQDLRSKMADKRFNKLLFMRSVLNKEQRIKYQELQSKWKGKRKRGQKKDSDD